LIFLGFPLLPLSDSHEASQDEASEQSKVNEKKKGGEVLSAASDTHSEYYLKSLYAGNSSCQTG
jgi:hypothetical protein